MLALPSDLVHAQESDGVRALRLALSRCDEEKAALPLLYPDGPCWLAAVGEADWEAEAHLIRAELQSANAGKPQAANESPAERQPQRKSR